jgi:hypothetical protein
MPARVAQTDIFRAIRSPYHRVLIVGADGHDVAEAFLMDDFQSSSSNEYSDFSGLMEGVNSGLQAARAVAGIGNDLVTGGQANAWLQQNIIQNVNQTVAVWNGSSKPSFSLPLMFVALNAQTDVRVPVTKLQRYTHPQFDATNRIGGLWITAPADYQASANAAPRGVVGISIGTWFHAKPLFLIKSLQVTLSKTPLKGSGLPLWAKVIIEFESYRIVSYDEAVDFFPNLNAGPPAPTPNTGSTGAGAVGAGNGGGGGGGF